MQNNEQLNENQSNKVTVDLWELRNSYEVPGGYALRMPDFLEMLEWGVCEIMKASGDGVYQIDREAAMHIVTELSYLAREIRLSPKPITLFVREEWQEQFFTMLNQEEPKPKPNKSFDWINNNALNKLIGVLMDTWTPQRHWETAPFEYKDKFLREIHSGDQCGVKNESDLISYTINAHGVAGGDKQPRDEYYKLEMSKPMATHLLEYLQGACFLTIQEPQGTDNGYNMVADFGRLENSED